MKKLKMKLLSHKIAIAIIGIFAIGFGVYAVTGGSHQIILESGAVLNYNEAQIPMTEIRASITEESLGGTPGTLHTQPERFLAGFGGAILATSTEGTATTLKESELRKYSVIEMTPNVASFTYTLPATSTLTTLLKNIGDTQSWVIQNATTTAATTLTLATAAGWNLSGDNVDVDVIAGAAYTSRVSMYIQCYRQSNKDINCNLSEAIAVD